MPLDPPTAAPGMWTFGASDVAKLLPVADAIAALEDAFRAQAEGRTLPSRVLGLHAPDGGLHVKAAGLWRGDRLYLAAKVNANFPGNPRRGRPTIQGFLVLFDGSDGTPLAVMDSGEITARRTAAATAVAARRLARRNAETLAVCGCGVQAAHQVLALSEVLPLRRVRLHDTEGDRAQALARTLSETTGLVATVAAGLETAVRGAHVIVTCTPSKAAFLRLEDVAPGAFVAGVGADHPEKSELAPSLLCGSRVVVDSLEQAQAIGDLHHALLAGAMGPEDVHAELWEVVAGRKVGRADAHEITVFDSTGVALEDVAAAALVYERAVHAAVADPPHGRQPPPAS